MSRAIAFDTFYYAKKHIDAINDFNDFNDFIDNSISIKQDLKELELKAEIVRMTYRLGGMVAGAVAVLGFLIKYTKFT